MKKAPRILISGLKGGSGKTLLSLGICAALSQSGVCVKPYKKGPDYIDAAWLSLAAGRQATNLDPFFLPAERLKSLFGETFPEGGLALIEGNRGLFDGRDVEGSCATAELAAILNCPVLVSMDCTKMTRTAAALVLGVTAFDPRVKIAGVVLNQVGTARQEQIIRQSIEKYTDIPVLGALPRLKENPLPERHMGLTAHTRTEAAAQIMETLAALVSEHTDLRKIQTVAEDTAPLDADGPLEDFWQTEKRQDGNVRIGYVKDHVLWFYYEENLEALRRAGAELVELSFADAGPWEGINGLYLGGGFPEDAAPELANAPQLAMIKLRADEGMPIYAECGGFMVLSAGITRRDGTYPMAGVFPVYAEFLPRPQGLGYVEGTVIRDTPFLRAGTVIRGHEFHYSRAVSPAGTELNPSLKLSQGTGMGRGRDGLVYRNTYASYTHIFAPILPEWAKNFVAAAQNYASGQR